MEHRSAYEAEIAKMPPGLDRAILRVLSYHIGKDRAIGRMEMVRQVGQLGCSTTERQLREQIKQLRREGYLIGSAPGEAGGYFLITSLAEFEEFDHREFEAKISDMSETRISMKKTAERMFGVGVQQTLF